MIRARSNPTAPKLQGERSDLGSAGGASGRRDEELELIEGAAINVALEGHHLLQRMPVVHPAPAFEFGARAPIESHLAFRCQETQREPFLLLADADRAARAAHVASRQAVTQPV